MNIQQRILKFVTITNWVLFFMASAGSMMLAPFRFTVGIICGGLLVTVNFHLLYRTLKKSLTPPHLGSHHVVLAKYYVRFVLSGIIIFVLIAKNYVNPLGLCIGLSVVVASIMLATICEFKKLIFKEAL